MNNKIDLRANIAKAKNDLMHRVESSPNLGFYSKNTLYRFLNDNDTNFFSRENPNGHITSSCFCVNEDVSRALLISHKKMGLWLQPGGHWDDVHSQPISVFDNALKELNEEVYDDKSIPLVKDIYGGTIYNIDCHSAGDHLHYDLGFLLCLDSSASLTPNLNEVRDAQWVDLQSVVNSPDGFTSYRVREVFSRILHNKQLILESINATPRHSAVGGVVKM